MGTAVPFQSTGRQQVQKKPTMNRMIALFALVACAFAEPEADPQLLVSPFTYLNAHSQSASLVQHPNGSVTPDDTASVKAAKLQHLATKFNPYTVGYTMPYTYAAAAPYTYTYSHAAAAPAISTFSPYISLAKREAEAEPQLLYNNFYGYNYGLSPYVSSYVASAPV